MIVDSITSALSDSVRLVFFTFMTFTIVRDEIGILQICTKFGLSKSEACVIEHQHFAPRPPDLHSDGKQMNYRGTFFHLTTLASHFLSVCITCNILICHSRVLDGMPVCEWEESISSTFFNYGE